MSYLPLVIASNVLIYSRIMTLSLNLTAILGFLDVPYCYVDLMVLSDLPIVCCRFLLDLTESLSSALDSVLGLRSWRISLILRLEKLTCSEIVGWSTRAHRNLSSTWDLMASLASGRSFMSRIWDFHRRNRLTFSS